MTAKAISTRIAALIDQGDQFLARGDPALALDSYKMALRIDSQCTEALLRIGGALMNSGQPAGAINHLERAHLVDESNTQLSGLLDAAYKHVCDAGIKGKTQNAQLRSACLKAISSFCEVYRSHEMHHKARATFKMLLRSYPNSFLLHYKMAGAYRDSGDLESAKRHFTKAVKLEPGFAEASAALGLVYERLGETVNGIKAISGFIEKGDNHPGISLAYAKLCLQQQEPQKGLQQIDRALAGIKKHGQNSILLHFQAGKICDAIGNYDRAFGHYEKGNELKAGYFKRQVFSRNIDQSIAKYDRAGLDSLPHMENSPERPIFIVGMPRSGTSLTEQILASHSEVCARGESRALRSVEKAYLDDIDGADVDALARLYFSEIGAPKKNTQCITDKMMYNYKRLYLIEMLFPNARIIHLSRNPIDNCLSIYFNNFSSSHQYSNRLEDIGFYYRGYICMMRHWCNVVRTPIFNLSYEKLVTSPELTIRELVDFCGLEWQDSCLRFFESGRYMHTSSYDQVRKPVYTGSVQRWRNYKKHLQPLTDSLGELAGGKHFQDPAY